MPNKYTDQQMIWAAQISYFNTRSAHLLLYFLKNTFALGEYVAVLNSQECSLSTDAFTTVLSGNRKKRSGLGYEAAYQEAEQGNRIFFDQISKITQKLIKSLN